MLLAAVTATVTATPLPSPEVIKEIVVQTNVPQDILNLFQVLGVIVAGWTMSFLHQVAERGRWNSNFNRLLLAAYSTVAALATAFLTGHWAFNLDAFTTGLTALVTALGSASGRYALVKFLADWIKTPMPVDTSSELA